MQYLKIDTEVGKTVLRNLSSFRCEKTLFLRKSDMLKSITHSTENYSGNHKYTPAIWTQKVNNSCLLPLA